MPLNDRKIARRAAAVLAGRPVPMTREQIHERAEARRRTICAALHTPSVVTQRVRCAQLGRAFNVSPSTICSIHSKHCYRKPAIDTGCTCEPDKRDIVCVRHGDPR